MKEPAWGLASGRWGYMMGLVQDVCGPRGSGGNRGVTMDGVDNGALGSKELGGRVGTG